MEHLFESATKQLQEMLGTDKVRVVFEDSTNQYEMHMQIPTYNEVEVPGCLLNSKEPGIKIKHSTTWWSCQNTFKEWNGEAIEKLRYDHYRLTNMELKEILDKRKRKRNQVDNSRQTDLKDFSKQVGKEIDRIMNKPTFYFSG
jgi:hypothetical protein